MRKTVFTLTLALAMLLAASTAPAAGVAGTWTMEVATDSASREFPITLEQSGEKVTAKIGEDPIAGTFKDGVLTMAGHVNSAEHGYGAELKMTGKLSGEKITGNLTWDTIEATFTMTPQ
jgi:hypothetical protein